jgi:hypothetical protein
VAAYPNFPELSRAFSLKQSENPVDPTLRDNMENGMESARARWTRNRRTFSMTVDLLTADDKAALDQFYTNMKAGGSAFGANPFRITDPRNAENPQTYLVRFLTLPKYTDADWIDVDSLGNAAQYRYNCTFQVREV